jgi:hypothetical protein
MARRTRTAKSSADVVHSATVLLVLTASLTALNAIFAQGVVTDRPLLRLGDSEFRLTAKGGDRRRFRFSPDGKLLAGANWDETRIWSFPDGKLKHDFSGIISSRCIGFADEGREFIALYEPQPEIFRFDVGSGRLIGKVKLEEVVEERGATHYHLSEDGRWLCRTEEYGNVCAWDTTTGKRLYRKELLSTHQCAVSREGVLTLWDNLFIDRYDVKTGERISRKKVSQFFIMLANNHSGTLFAGYSPNDKAIVFWDAEKDQRFGGMIPFEVQRHWRYDEGAISADGQRFVFWIDQGKYTW